MFCDFELHNIFLLYAGIGYSSFIFNWYIETWNNIATDGAWRYMDFFAFTSTA